MSKLKNIRHVLSIKEIAIDSLNHGLEAPLKVAFCNEKGIDVL